MIDLRSWRCDKVTDTVDRGCQCVRTLLDGAPPPRGDVGRGSPFGYMHMKSAKEVSLCDVRNLKLH